MVMSTNQPKGWIEGNLENCFYTFPPDVGQLLSTISAYLLDTRLLKAGQQYKHNSHTCSHIGMFLLAFLYCHGSQTCALQDCRSDKIILLHMGGEETIWGTWGGFRGVSCLLWCIWCLVLPSNGSKNYFCPARVWIPLLIGAEQNWWPARQQKHCTGQWLGSHARERLK